jgi:polysaccharide export outer membrane protein
VDLNPAVLDCLAGVGDNSFLKTFGGLGSGKRPPGIVVGVGDVLEVSVFESSNGGLYLPPGPNGRVGNYVSFPNQTVSDAGTITVPYAGNVPVAGRTVPDIQRDIEAKLQKRALEPQVIITLIEQNRDSVTVIGDALNVGVGGAGKIKLSGSGEHILDLVSKAGGLKFPAYDTFISIQRKGRVATIYLPTIINHPEENIFAQPGDLIYVYRDQQKYVAAGAIGATAGGGTIAGNNSLVQAVGLFSFDQEHLSLNEALAKAGGLQDIKADPAQVFLYRMERRDTLEKMGVDLSSFPAGQDVIPTVYRANFRDPSSYLFTQRFMMRNKDTIYVGNADSVEFTKLLAYTTAITGTMSGVATDAHVVWWQGP